MYYTITELSKLLNCSEETIRRWVRTGKIIGEKKSNKDGYRIPKDNTDFLKERINSVTLIEGFDTNTLLLAKAVLSTLKQKKIERGKKLLLKRKALGLSTRDIANELGCSYQTICNIEKGSILHGSIGLEYENLIDKLWGVEYKERLIEELTRYLEIAKAL